MTTMLRRARQREEAQPTGSHGDLVVSADHDLEPRARSGALGAHQDPSITA